MFAVDRLQAPFYGVERITDGNVDIFVGMIVVLIVGNHDVMVRNQGFNTYVIDLAFVMIVVRCFESYFKALDFVAVAPELFQSFVNGFFNRRGMIDVAKNYLSITNHRCASCTLAL